MVLSIPHPLGFAVLSVLKHSAAVQHNNRREVTGLGGCCFSVRKTRIRRDVSVRTILVYFIVVGLEDCPLYDFEGKISSLASNGGSESMSSSTEATLPVVLTVLAM
mmetsp:Transcript_21362/g.48201  ORF Transcript_21362/g.48201 Transcript_21362/m.48201 type:complete len:106 (+) Transcript_21362:2601-2918(+)